MGLEKSWRSVSSTINILCTDGANKLPTTLWLVSKWTVFFTNRQTQIVIAKNQRMYKIVKIRNVIKLWKILSTLPPDVNVPMEMSLVHRLAFTYISSCFLGSMFTRDKINFVVPCENIISFHFPIVCMMPPIQKWTIRFPPSHSPVLVQRIPTVAVGHRITPIIQAENQNHFQ